jgi:hypothetical protein
MTYRSISRRNILLGGLGAVLMPAPGIAQQGRDPASQEPTTMRIRMTFNGLELTGTLYDNASARDFFSLLPLDISIEDYANNEKIAYLPRALTLEGSGWFINEQPGDICYFAPWGNLALFYSGYRYSNGLVRLGRFDDFQPLLTRGEFPLRIEAI